MLYVADLEEGTELEAAIQAVRSGAVPGKELEEKKNPEVLFAFEGSGKYAIAVIAYNEDGEEVATQAAAIDIIDNSADFNAFSPPQVATRVAIEGIV